MTVTTPATKVITAGHQPNACPGFCDFPMPNLEHVHSRDIKEAWGATSAQYGEAKLGLALEQEDGEPEAKVNVQFSRDGVTLDDSISLPFGTAESYAYTILRLVAEGRAA